MASASVQHCSIEEAGVTRENLRNVVECPNYLAIWLIHTTSLHRGSLYRDSTVHMPTPPPSQLPHFEHLYLQFTRSINIAAFVSWGRGGGQNKQRSHLYSDMYLPS